MEDKKIDALNDEALDEVAGGHGRDPKDPELMQTFWCDD